MSLRRLERTSSGHEPERAGRCQIFGWVCAGIALRRTADRTGRRAWCRLAGARAEGVSWACEWGTVAPRAKSCGLRRDHASSLACAAAAGPCMPETDARAAGSVRLLCAVPVPGTYCVCTYEVGEAVVCILLHGKRRLLETARAGHGWDGTEPAQRAQRTSGRRRRRATTSFGRRDACLEAWPRITRGGRLTAGRVCSRDGGDTTGTRCRSLTALSRPTVGRGGQMTGGLSVLRTQ